MGKIEGLAHLGFFVDDMDRSIQFYTDVLGFSLRCRWEVPGVKAALLDLGDCCLEMMQYIEKHEFSTGRYDHLALRVTDIEAVWNDLKAKRALQHRRDHRRSRLGHAWRALHPLPRS